MFISKILNLVANLVGRMVRYALIAFGLYCIYLSLAWLYTNIIR